MTKKRGRPTSKSQLTAMRNKVAVSLDDQSRILDSVLVDPEFDEVKQVDLEELVGRGYGTSNYD